MALNVINTVLCIVIVILGCLTYKKDRKMPPLFIGIAFGIFGISHIFTIIGLEGSLLNFLIAIRAIAYLLVVFALFVMVKEK
ncbi:MAG: hypothetical protein D4S01_01665 [Dehalococcoidia bacterium]|nr:MAG: hypothetical protein D4S01_01665 [Dehalococcoidia bacterium]